MIGLANLGFPEWELKAQELSWFFYISIEIVAVIVFVDFPWAISLGNYRLRLQNKFSRGKKTSLTTAVAYMHVQL